MITSVAISPDGKTIVSGSDDKAIKLWDAGAREWRGAAAPAYRTLAAGFAVRGEWGESHRGGWWGGLQQAARRRVAGLAFG